MIAPASSFLTCKPMRSLFTQTCQQKQVFLVSLLLKKMREEVGAYSKGGGGVGGRFFGIMKQGVGTHSGKGTYQGVGAQLKKYGIHYLYPSSEQTSSYLKYLMNSCIFHSEPSILRLLHYAVTLLIAKIFHNYEFELEFLILVVLSCCGVSNMVSRHLFFYQFLFKYYFAHYLFVFHLFYSYFYQIIIYTFSTYVLLGA